MGDGGQGPKRRGTPLASLLHVGEHERVHFMRASAEDRRERPQGRYHPRLELRDSEA
jgi:hypothetical protein